MPEDAKDVLIYSWVIISGYWSKTMGFVGNNTTLPYEATHWMPLPAPPTDRP